MKKVMMVLMTFVLSFMVLACDVETLPTTTEPTTTESTMTTTDGTAVSSGTQTTTEGSGPTEDIVLSYADWGNQELNQYLIDAFEEEHPNITVELRKDISGTGGEFTANLLNAQAAGVLPDVFAIDNVPTGYYNGMLLDITEYWDNDPETDLVYDNIAETAVYEGKRYAVPSFQFIKGIYLNITLFKHYNIELPAKDWHYDDYIAIAREIRRVGKNDYVYGIDPWYGMLDFETTFPMQDDVDLGYNTWDGQQFNFTSPLWIDAYNLKLDLMEERVVASYTPEEMAAIGEDTWPWYAGLIGTRIDGSWNLWMIDTMYTDNNIEVGFWPYPGGDAGQYPPTILDYQVVSSQTEYPEEAYELAKWMTFGKQGWLKRLDYMEENNELYIDRFPVSDIPEVWAEIDYYLYYVEGLRESVENLDQAKPDTDKWLPGYKQFWEWVGNEENDYWTKIEEGLVSPSTFAPVWEDKINQMVQDALSQDEE